MVRGEGEDGKVFEEMRGSSLESLQFPWQMALSVIIESSAAINQQFNRCNETVLAWVKVN